MKRSKNEVPAAPRPTVFSRLRSYFFAGLAIAAPIAITVWATLWFINIFDTWIKPYIPDGYNPDTYLPIHIPGFGLIFALICITLVGALATNLVGRSLIALWDSILNRTPVVRSVYKGSKQIFHTLFQQNGTSFKKVCLVEWPRPGAWSIGFISREMGSEAVGLPPGEPMVAVYVSTTPNPTSGYVFFCKLSDVIMLDIPVEDGLKLVISMGLILPDKPITPETSNQAELIQLLNTSSVQKRGVKTTTVPSELSKKRLPSKQSIAKRQNQSKD